MIDKSDNEESVSDDVAWEDLSTDVADVEKLDVDDPIPEGARSPSKEQTDAKLKEIHVST